MKFWAMFKKEFREILPWVLLGLVLFVISVGFYVDPVSDFAKGQAKKQSQVFMTQSLEENGLNMIMVYIITVSSAFGAFIALRQFWYEGATRTSVCTLHRPLTKFQILFAKTLAGIVGYSCILILWYFLYIVLSKAASIYVPLNSETFVVGGLALLSGFVIYLGGGMAGITSSKLMRVLYVFFTLLMYLILMTSEFEVKSYSLILSALLIFMFINLSTNFICREWK